MQQKVVDYYYFQDLTIQVEHYLLLHIVRQVINVLLLNCCNVFVLSPIPSHYYPLLLKNQVDLYSAMTNFHSFYQSVSMDDQNLKMN